MPYTPLSIKAILTANFVTSGVVGSQTPTLVDRLGDAIALWLPTIVVNTVDTGTAGVGTGVGFITLPTPLVILSMQQAFLTEGINGVQATLMLTALANSLVQIFASTTIQTTHPTVGTGVAVATFTVPIMQFPPLGGTFGDRIPNALELAARTVLSPYTTSFPIVGSPSNTPSTGVGTGILF